MLKRLQTLALTAAVALAPMVAAAQSSAPDMAPASASSNAKVKAAKTLECSKEAKARGLVGKTRKKFLADCERNVM